MNTPFDRHFLVSPDVAPRRRRTALRALLAGSLVAAFMMFGMDPASAAKPKKGFEPTLPAPAPIQPAPPTAGSIFNASTGYIGFVEGRRANAVGDLVTVVLVENIILSLIHI